MKRTSNPHEEHFQFKWKGLIHPESTLGQGTQAKQETKPSATRRSRHIRPVMFGTSSQIQPSVAEVDRKPSERPIVQSSQSQERKNRPSHPAPGVPRGRATRNEHHARIPPSLRGVFFTPSLGAPGATARQLCFTASWTKRRDSVSASRWTVSVSGRLAAWS